MNDNVQEIWPALNAALARLQEAVDTPLDDSPFVLDATIQRFEFTFELFWKALQKLLLAQESIEANSPRLALQEAFKLRLIDNEKLWVSMLQDRNLTSHTYKQKIALEVYERIGGYAEAIAQTIALLKERYSLA